jgi:parallel beta-helix repeat protein
MAKTVSGCGLRTLALLVLPAVVVAAAIVSAWVPATRPADASSAATSSVTVHYDGPRGLLPRDAHLRATARSSTGRVVAATFLLDGRPLGTDTSPPFTLDLDSRLVQPGAHRLRVTAVDSLGARAESPVSLVRTVASSAGVLALSPEAGLQPALAALAHGDATVRLRPGRYSVHNLVVGSGATLVGSGPGTVLAAPAGSDSTPLLRLHGRGIRVADLAIDAAGQGGREPTTVAVADGSQDVLLQRLTLTGVHGDAVNIWGAHANVSVQDSLIDGGGGGHAGVFALESAASRDTSVIRTRIRSFRSFGVLFAQKDYGLRAAGLHALALDNTISEIRDPGRAGCRSNPLGTGCGTNEIGIETGAVAASVVDNTISRTAWDGVETVGSSTSTTVVGNRISQTPTGVYLEHSTNGTLVARNLISDVDTGINVEWRYDGVGSQHNTFQSNRVADARKHAVYVGPGENGNTIVGNVFVRGSRPAILLQGSSGNRVNRNRACGSHGDLVAQADGRSDRGATVRSEGNDISGNTDQASCRTR